MVKPRDGFKNFQFRDSEALMVALCEHAAAVEKDGAARALRDAIKILRGEP